MADTFDKAFEVNVLSLDNRMGIFGGDNDPDIDAETAPRGSLFLKTTGETFRRHKMDGRMDDWTEVNRPIPGGEGGDPVLGCLPFFHADSSVTLITMIACPGESTFGCLPFWDRDNIQLNIPMINCTA